MVDQSAEQQTALQQPDGEKDTTSQENMNIVLRMWKELVEKRNQSNAAELKAVSERRKEIVADKQTAVTAPLNPEIARRIKVGPGEDTSLPGFDGEQGDGDITEPATPIEVPYEDGSEGDTEKALPSLPDEEDDMNAPTKPTPPVRSGSQETQV